MSDEQLIEIKAGASASTLNAIARIINSILTIGQMIGSAIKRKLRGEINAC